MYWLFTSKRYLEVFTLKRYLTLDSCGSFFDVVACTYEIFSVYKMMCLLLLNLEKVVSEAVLTLWTILELF